MAKKLTNEQREAAIESSKKAAAETAGIKLDQRFVDESKSIGAILGGFSLAKDSAAEALRKAALMLFDLQIEGAIGIVNARAENFISRIVHAAFVAKYGEKHEFNMKGEQVLSNNQTQLRRISKALSLDGFVYRVDDAGNKVKIPVRDNLRRMLEGWSSTDNKGKVTHYTGKFNPAVAKAFEWIKLHDSLCVSDADYAQTVGYNPPAEGTKGRGRAKQEPSDNRFSAILDDVGYMLRPQLIKTIQAAVNQAINSWPASAKSYVNRKSELSELLGQIVGMIENVPSELASELTTNAKEQSDLALAGRTKAEGNKAKTTPVPADTITAKRTSKRKTAKKQVETDVPEQVAA